eukprot:jgi/Astpho2/5665/Aster-x1306
MFVPRRKLVLADSQPLQHSDCPWDDELDSGQPQLQRQARALPMQGARLNQPSDLPAAQQQLTPQTVASTVTGQAQGPLGLATISLETYQEAFSSLTRGTGSVQPVSMQEKALYKMSDLKQELLDKMQGMQLFDPVLLPPKEVWMEVLMPPGLSRGASSCVTGAELQQLGWASATPALEAALASQGTFLPTLPKLESSHSDVTMPFTEGGSQPPAGTDAAYLPGWQEGPAALHKDSQGKECPNECCKQHPEMPQWLPEACSKLSYRLRAAASSSSSVGGYIGQQVAFVLLDDVIADSDSIRDVLKAGLHVGRVRENIGAMHQKDLCEAECSQDHSFHCVRLADAWLLLEPVQSSGQSTLPKATKPPQAQEKLAASKSVERAPAKRRSNQPTEHKRSPAQKRAKPAAAPLSGDKQGSNKKPRSLPVAAAEASTQGAAKLASAPEAAAPQGGWQLKQGAQKKKPPAAVEAAQGVTAADVSTAQDGPTPGLPSRRPRPQAGATGSAATALPTFLRPGAVVWTKFGALLWPAQLLSAKAGSGDGVVQLFGIHTRISVLLSGLEAFSGQPDQCVLLHSELGKQAIMEALQHLEM